MLKREEMSMMKLTKGVHCLPVPTPFQVGDVNVYLLRGDCLTLVDTGPLTEEAEQALEAGLREAGVRVEDLEQIVLTHYHCDHIGLLERLVERSGAKVYAHPLTNVIIEGDPQVRKERLQFFRERLYRPFGLTAEETERGIEQFTYFWQYLSDRKADAALAEGQEVPGAPGWRVVYTPGHARDHLSLYGEQDGVMLLGDHLIKHISSNAFVEPPLSQEEEPYRSLVLYREALRKVQALEWRIGYAGHGEPITEHKELIEKRLRDQERRAQLFRELVANGTDTGIGIARKVFPRYRAQIPLVVSEVLGHLEWLVEEGRLAEDVRADGVKVYRAL
jgi:glyoxylase-like metal-dependent hydrolase (beta-lactamase superfamily II)